MHWADVAVIIAYLAIIVIVGLRAGKARSEEGFLLAGRKLGKVFQFFLNFGNACDANGAVSTASVVYEQGISGIWISFQTVFMNPYYWFMATWFRRARLVTSGDLFEDRFGSRGLARFYALFQVGVAILLIAFGNFVGYKVTSAVLGRDFGAFPFYLVYTAVVASYIIAGGLGAAALNQAVQGTLIIVFSFLLIPAGLHSAGGWHALAAKIPSGMLDLFGGTSASEFTGWAVLAVLLVSLIQMHSVLSQMTILGAARNEFAARFGLSSGTYAKRLMIVLWALVGLIAIAIFRGPDRLADPDSVWGTSSRLLLGAGVRGLMVAGILAADMSSLAAQTVTVAGLFVRNIYGAAPEGRSAENSVRSARFAMGIVLVLGVVLALLLNNLKSIMLLILYGNVGFGAAIFMIFHWRRLTAPAIWVAVTLTLIVTLVVPFTAQFLPSVRSNPEYLGGPAHAPRYFDAVDAHGVETGQPVGHGRFNFELYLLKSAGLKTQHLTAGGALAAQFFFDGFFPFAVLMLVSYVTSPTDRSRVERFYGKLKTPVGASPDLDRASLEETGRNPARFDGLKLFPRTHWEFCRWTREDAVGFLVCCVVSGGILGSFWLLLRTLT